MNDKILFGKGGGVYVCVVIVVGGVWGGGTCVWWWLKVLERGGYLLLVGVTESVNKLWAQSQHLGWSSLSFIPGQHTQNHGAALRGRGIALRWDCV